jgi:DNA-binding protein YbaB
MFDKVKKINELRKAQSKIQKQLEEIYISEESGDYEVVIRGDKKIEKIVISGEENDKLRNLLNSAMKQVDKKVQKKMRGQLSELGLDL